jgi:putative phosphoesterase
MRSLGEVANAEKDKVKIVLAPYGRPGRHCKMPAGCGLCRSSYVRQMTVQGSGAKLERAFLKGICSNKLERHAVAIAKAAEKMRVAIVSDIHGNRRAFEAVLADLRQVAPDLVVHGGDLAYGGTHPAEVIDRVRALGWPGVRGNTDEMLWAPQSLAEFAAKAPKLAPLLSRIQELIPPALASIGEQRLRWLEALPQQYSSEGFSLVHASPGDLWRAPMPNAGDDELQSTYASLHTPIVVYGHIHVPYIRRLPGMTIANTGSVSQCYDGDRRASYAVIAGETLTIRRVEYDVEREAQDLLHSGLPHADWLARILVAGKYCPPE